MVKLPEGHITRDREKREKLREEDTMVKPSKEEEKRRIAAAMLQPRFMAHMTAHKYGPYVDIATILYQSHGLDGHLFSVTMQ